MLQAIGLLNLGLRKRDRSLHAGPECELARGIEVNDVHSVVDDAPVRRHMMGICGEHIVQAYIL